MSLPKLYLTVSEILKAHVDGKLQIVHNSNTFEPYFLYEGKLHDGNDDEVWNHVELINKLNKTYRSGKTNESMASDKAARSNQQSQGQGTYTSN